jgi:hypothetical protein
MMLIAEWMTLVDPTGASVAQRIKLVAQRVSSAAHTVASVA